MSLLLLDNQVHLSHSLIDLSLVLSVLNGDVLDYLFAIFITPHVEVVNGVFVYHKEGEDRDQKDSDCSHCKQQSPTKEDLIYDSDEDLTDTNSECYDDYPITSQPIVTIS